VIEKRARRRIERPDRFHILVFELESKNVEVLCHPLSTYRFRDDDNPSLDQPTQDQPARRSPPRRPICSRTRIAGSVTWEWDLLLLR
jgi:hypothetical protein